MTNEQLQQRNEAIKQSMKDTALKRQTQVAIVFSCKIQENKLSACQKEQLKMMFVEGKWLYNDFISFISNLIFGDLELIFDSNFLIKSLNSLFSLLK
mgnify:CR=1 FL=1